MTGVQDAERAATSNRLHPTVLCWPWLGETAHCLLLMRLAYIDYLMEDER